MVPFAGYNMPVSYSGLNDEHATVRNAMGVFDVSHMGEFVLKGDNALDLIQRVTSNVERQWVVPKPVSGTIPERPSSSASRKASCEAPNTEITPMPETVTDRCTGRTLSSPR